ncbi:uncharacterized protein LOC129241760 [Anastrepha obliqua]|uniref:uncharacterized protein LOC129241760 n=1 Tax=Anastrepha obliqua TaxID=95512 RepID=UPI00240988F3|nr:uncharacterized protein LOC129241760 [Anastrepha obliqua]
MANMWHDKRTYVDENKFVSAKLHQVHPRVHSVKKKQVFGELKNVIHNQIGVTPLKGDVKETNLLHANKGVRCNDNGVTNKKSCFQNEGGNKFTLDPNELFDLFDFPKSCCTESCTKSDEEIWTEYYGGVDEVALVKVMEKIRSGGSILDFDEKSNSDIEEFYEPEEDFSNLLTKSIKPHLYLEDYDDGDFPSCAAELPKFDVFNDILMKC